MFIALWQSNKEKQSLGLIYGTIYYLAEWCIEYIGKIEIFLNLW